MIFISAGHHPSAPGATYERFVEHDEAVIWAEIMVDGLGDNGALVPTGVLKSKVDYINSRIMDGDVAIEIHFNSAMKDGEHVGRGSETLYYPGSEDGEELAETVQSALREVFPPDRGIKEGWYHMDPERGADFFLAKTKCPALIIEPDFVHRSDLIIERRHEAIQKMIEVLNVG
jgi:N-acetylmuramoyl-L-alanine amidase